MLIQDWFKRNCYWKRRLHNFCQRLVLFLFPLLPVASHFNQNSQLNSFLKTNTTLGEVLYTHMQIHAEHNDTMITTRQSFRKIYLSLYLKGLCVRGSWRLNRTAIYWPSLLWPSALCLSHSPGLLNQRQGTQLSAECCHQRVWSPN